jgi:hypothetical protein
MSAGVPGVDPTAVGAWTFCTAGRDDVVAGVAVGDAFAGDAGLEYTGEFAAVGVADVPPGATGCAYGGWLPTPPAVLPSVF